MRGPWCMPWSPRYFLEFVVRRDLSLVLDIWYQARSGFRQGYRTVSLASTK